jgi:hypothetical protein
MQSADGYDEPQSRKERKGRLLMESVVTLRRCETAMAAALACMKGYSPHETAAATAL